MDDIFTNREIAEITVIAIIIIYALFRKQVKTSLLNVMKCALNIKIIEYFFSYLFYFSSIVYLCYNLKWLDITNLKDTMIWFIFSGLSIGVFVGTNKLESGFWKKLILDNLKFNVLVEFVISLFTFSLIVELIIVSVIGFIVLLNSFSRINNQYKAVEKLTSLILTFIGLFILVYSLHTVTDIYSIVNMNNLKSFLFPLLFSIISVPYMYIFKLIVEYDKLFHMLRLGRERSRELNSLIKRQLLLFLSRPVYFSSH